MLYWRCVFFVSFFSVKGVIYLFIFNPRGQIVQCDSTACEAHVLTQTHRSLIYKICGDVNECDDMRKNKSSHKHLHPVLERRQLSSWMSASVSIYFSILRL